MVRNARETVTPKEMAEVDSRHAPPPANLNALRVRVVPKIAFDGFFSLLFSSLVSVTSLHVRDAHGRMSEWTKSEVIDLQPERNRFRVLYTNY